MPAYDRHADQLAVDQDAVRIGHRGADQHRVGGAIDRYVDEIDRAFLFVGRPVGKTDLDLDAIGVAEFSGQLRLQQFALADRKRHIHRILADDGREHAAVRADDVAGRDIGFADLAVDRRRDIGIAEIDVRRVQIGLIGHDGALGLLVRGKRLIAGDDSAGILVEQILRALQLDRGEHLGRFGSLQIALGLLDVGLEQSLLDAVERIALLDLVAFLEKDLVQITLDPRSDLDAIGRFDAPDEIARLCNRPFLGIDSADRHGRLLLRLRGDCRRQRQGNSRGAG